ncbi:MAG: hypothetical protein JSV62_01460 [Promethearchaeota archaeon]|nr:MAG: hypothetical protein JSV62_01460 [Candidatus Lokiarchaeota archaeon]
MEKPATKSNKLPYFVVLEFILLVISILIPYLLVNANQTDSCLHHLEEENGTFWIIGRAFGFTTFIWFIISTLFGIKTKKIVKIFGSYKKARDLHCLNATITIIVFFVHIGSLLGSEPWGELILDGEVNHLPYPLFLTKVLTGVLFGIILVSVSVSAFYFRDLDKMKRFGFKNFIKIHYIMLGLSVILGIHIFLINTEILIIFWG